MLLFREKEKLCAPPGPSPGARDRNEATRLQPIRNSRANHLRIALQLPGISLLRLDAMHLLRINWGFGEHRFLGHAKVALRVVGGYVPFIAKEKLDLAPRYFRLQQRV